MGNFVLLFLNETIVNFLYKQKVVEKRYSQFRELRQELRKLNITSSTASSSSSSSHLTPNPNWSSSTSPTSSAYAGAGSPHPSPNSKVGGSGYVLPPFPKKKWFFNLTKTALKKRQTELSDFMAFLVGLVPQPMEIGQRCMK